jgi:hypothetical protein
MMQNIIPDQNQITYRILVVKIVSIKNKLDKMVMSVKNNLQRIAQKYEDSMCQGVLLEKVSFMLLLLDIFHFLNNIHILILVYV